MSKERIKPAKLLSETLEAIKGKDEEALASLLPSIKDRKKEIAQAIKKKIEKKEDIAHILTLAERLDDPDLGKIAKLVAENSALPLSLRLKAVEIAEAVGAKLEPGVSSAIREGMKLFSLIKDEEADLPSLSSRVKELPLDVKLSLIADLALLPEKAIAFFPLLLGERAELDGAIIDALGKIETPASLSLLLSELERTSDKERIKKIRKAIHQLKSKGVEPPSRETPGEKRKEEEEGYLSPIDSLGERLLVLVMPKGRGEVRFFQIIASDTKGILRFITHSVPYEELMSSIRRAEETKGIQMVEAPADYIRTLLGEYAGLNEKGGGKPPAEFVSWRNWIGEPRERFEKPLIYQFIPEEDIAAREALFEQGDRLFQLPGIIGWFIPEEEIKEGVERFATAEESPLILSDIQREERRNKIFLEEAERYFTEEKKELYKRRLIEMGYFLYQKGMKLEAEIALATAHAFSSHEIKFIPFALTLVKRSIELAVKKRKEAEKKEPRLIIPPSAQGGIGERK